MKLNRVMRFLIVVLFLVVPKPLSSQNTFDRVAQYIQGKNYRENYEEGTQRNSQSISFSPVLTLPYTSIPWLVINSSLASNISYDFQSYAPNSKNIVAEPMLRKNFTLLGTIQEASSLVFERHQAQ